MISVLADDAAMAALAGEWADLWGRAGGSPFQSPAWLLAWWSVWGTGAPRVATLRDGAGRLIGVLPLYLLAAEGKLLPIGAGVTDAHDALVDPAAPTGAADALLRAVLGPARLPCHLIELPEGALLRTADAGAGWASTIRDAEPSPVLPLAGPVPARQRRKLRMARHRAAEIGGFGIEDGTFADLVRLHGARWRAQGEAGVLDDPAVQAFHATALPALRAAGLLRLRAVRLRGAVAAVTYALVDHTRIHFYLTGFDAAFARESPGTLLLGAMLEEATAEGRTAAHFLRGGEAYKFAWGACPAHNATRVLTPV